MIYIGNMDIRNHIQVDTDLTVYGTFKNDVDIVKEGFLRLFGCAEQSVSVHNGGYLVLEGGILGDLIVFGGRVEIVGYVDGNIVQYAGEVSVLPISGRALPEIEIM